MSALRSPVRWYGGKGQMLGKLSPLLPPHRTYVEPFAGGAALFFAKAPAPVEVLNDLDGGLINFYRVLRNPAMFAEFARLCELTPYSREEWAACRAGWQAYSDPIARAWAWFVWVRQTFGGGGQTYGGWQLVKADSTRGIASNVAHWLTAVEGLPAVHARLRTAQIECQDWRGILKQYDTPATLFYCDPPYMQETRGRHRYGQEMQCADHADLVAALLNLQGAAILSGYRHPLYRPLETAGWQRIDWALDATVAPAPTPRVESVWLNMVCQDARLPLFAQAAP